ncbi:MAG: hypothetical protein K0S80_2236 [Neobacillus sp.]|nr:hypothetical protein [Neobacillus sp.]
MVPIDRTLEKECFTYRYYLIKLPYSRLQRTSGSPGALKLSFTGGLDPISHGHADMTLSRGLFIKP